MVKGFTLIELMVTVAILGIIAVLAVVSYGRYTRKAVTSEAYAMLGEIRIKEEAYVGEAGTYLSTNTTDDETDVFPRLATPQGYSVRNWGTHTTDRWALLGIRPPRSQLYCGYVARAGALAGGNYGAPTSGSHGAAIFGTINDVNQPIPHSGANITVPWYYARACCDLQTPYVTGSGTCPSDRSNVTVYAISFYDTTLREENPGN